MSTSSVVTVKRCVFELREVEDVADKALEPVGLQLDRLE